MKILGVESSSNAASCAIIEDGELKAEYFINNKKTHSQTLLPMISDMIKIIDVDINSLDAIAIANGPGSFTGLRIGAATVRGFAFGLNKPIISISTLDAMSINIYGDVYIVPMIDARCSQVFTCIYDGGDRQEEMPRALIEKTACHITDLISIINKICTNNKKVVFLGDGVKAVQDIIKDNINIDYDFAPLNINLQKASCIALLADRYIKLNGLNMNNDFDIDYLRKSRAEQERERNANNQ